jgi:hypothetical protein
MTLRSTRTNSSGGNSSGPNSRGPLAALDYEVAQEQASALGRAGRMLEQALRALADHDNGATADRTARAQLVQTAGDALWCFMVQRESIGLRDPRPVLRDYRVPAEVQNRMGVFERRSRA